jgi:hypothetical protein
VYDPVEQHDGKEYDVGWIAMRSLYPMLLLMIGYAIAGLWILAQPLV